MYYLVDSEILTDFEGLAGMKRRESDRLVVEMGKLYTLKVRNLAEHSGQGPIVSGDSGEEGETVRREKTVVQICYCTVSDLEAAGKEEKNDTPRHEQ